MGQHTIPAFWLCLVLQVINGKLDINAVLDPSFRLSFQKPEPLPIMLWGIGVRCRD